MLRVSTAFWCNLLSVLIHKQKVLFCIFLLSFASVAEAVHTKLTQLGSCSKAYGQLVYDWQRAIQSV